MLERVQGRPYFYRYERVGGRARRVYSCSGEAAIEAARRQDERRTRREAESAEVRGVEQAHEDALAPLGELDAALEAATRAVLEGLGYHRHARGDWRLRRKGSHGGAEGVPGRAEGDPAEGVAG